jgi:hypothetical protein
MYDWLTINFRFYFIFEPVNSDIIIIVHQKKSKQDE